MQFDRSDIERLRALSKMNLSEEEVDRLQGEVSSILKFVETLNSAPTDGVEPTSQVTGLENVVRSDVHVADYTAEEMTATMPSVDKNGHLVVHAVFTGDSPSN